MSASITRLEPHNSIWLLNADLTYNRSAIMLRAMSDYRAGHGSIGECQRVAWAHARNARAVLQARAEWVALGRRAA